jgi:hypothetical protein
MRANKRLAAAVVALAAVGGVAAIEAPGALADYGSGAQYQVIISANFPPNVFGAGTGGGIWLWIELDGTSKTSGGTGEYHGADALHHAPQFGPQGASPDSGDNVTWSLSGGTLTITGVAIGGGTTPVTITVPNSGHETTSLGAVFPGLLPPGIGTAQVQVSP